MELKNDLFVNIDKETGQGEENFYNEVLEERTKLDTKRETDAVSVTTTNDQLKESKLTNQNSSLKKYSHEEVLLKATEYFKGDTLVIEFNNKNIKP